MGSMLPRGEVINFVSVSNADPMESGSKEESLFFLGVHIA